MLVAGLGKATSLPFLQVGRAISLVAALVGALVVGLMAQRFSGRRLPGLMAAALFLANPFVMHWARMARVDLLALALSLLALWLVYTRWQSVAWLSVAGLCLLASIYTRQTYALAAPLASAVWLWHHSRRRAMAFAASLAGACLALFVLLNDITGGGFYLNIVAANVNPYLILRTLSMGALVLLFCPVVLAVAGLEVKHALMRRGSVGDRDDEGTAQSGFLLHGWLPYTVGAVISALTIGKIGSHVNYLVELMAALAVWASLAFRGHVQRFSRRQVVLRLLMLCQVAWLLGIGYSVQASTFRVWDDVAGYDSLYAEVKAASRQGPVLADDLMGMVVMAGQRVYLQPFEYEQLRSAALWDESDLVEEIESHKFPLILISDPGSELFAERWSPRVATAIEEHYTRTETLRDVVIYRPLPSTESGGQ
jgi:hypothetical protein